MKKLFALVALVGLGGFVAGCGDSPAPDSSSHPTGPPAGMQMGPPGGKPGDLPGKSAETVKEGEDKNDDAAGAKGDSKDDAAATEEKAKDE